MQNFTGREREKERVEDLNIFLGFLFTGIHSSELKMLTIDDDIYYVTQTHGM
jgi:hypothetical protein